MNTSINLGSSFGTAILGLILILGGFSSVDVAVNHEQSTGVQENILGFHGLFDKLGIEHSGDQKQVYVNDQKVNTMKSAFNVINHYPNY